MPRSLTATMIACGLATALAGAACSERGEMAADRNDETAQSAGTAGADRTPVTVTGCFQEAEGFNNFVLTNTTGAGSSPEQRAMGYRIERGGDIEQHVGKQVRITGWTDDDETSTMSSNRPAHDQQAGTSGQANASRQTTASERTGRDAGDAIDYDDYPELHVENIEKVSDNCGNTSKPAKK